MSSGCRLGPIRIRLSAAAEAAQEPVPLAETAVTGAAKSKPSNTSPFPLRIVTCQICPYSGLQMFLSKQAFVMTEIDQLHRETAGKKVDIQVHSGQYRVVAQSALLSSIRSSAPFIFHAPTLPRPVTSSPNRSTEAA